MAGTSARRTARVVLLAAATTIVTTLGAATAAADERRPLPPLDVPVTTPGTLVPPLDQSVQVPHVTVPTLTPSPTAVTPPTTAHAPAPSTPRVHDARTAPSPAPHAPTVTTPAPPSVELPVRHATTRPPLTFARMRNLARSHAEEFAFPFALVALVLLFLAGQHRLGANDPRLSAAPIDDDLRRFR